MAVKFEMNVIVHHDTIQGILVDTGAGVYSINLDRNRICFEKNVKLSDLLTNNIFLVSEFTESDLIPKENFDGVLHYPCGKLQVGSCFRKELIMEYLDTSGGQIPRHSHPEGVQEIYLSLDPPYEGKLCSFGCFHEPFCNHTLAIKVVYKRLI